MTSLPRIGVVGVGYMGSRHLAKLASLAAAGEVRLAGILDIDPARAREQGERFGAPVLEGIASLVDGADAAVVAVPTSAHARVAGALLESGLDVLLEKPIATTREEARRLIEISHARGRVLQVGHVERFSAVLRSLLPVLRRPRFIEAHRIGPYPGRATDVGVVLDLMIHDLDLILHIAASEVEHVEAIGVAVLSATEDIANARIRFTNGCIANVTASRVSLESLRRIRFFQSDAYVSIDFVTGRALIARREGAPGGDPPPKIQAEERSLDRGDALLAQLRAFVLAVRERSEPEVTSEEAYRALDLALRIRDALPSLEELLA